MNEKLDAEIAAIAGSDQTATAIRQVGQFAAGFISGAMDTGLDFGEALQLYGAFTEANAAGNHCCCCTQNKQQS